MAKRERAGKLDGKAIIRSFKEPEILDDVANLLADEPVNESTEDVPEPDEQPEAPREETKRRRNKSVNYQTAFFKNAEEKTRSGKVVYIKKKYHDRMMKILRIVGDNEITLFSYLNNILEYHFDMFHNDIKELYQEKNTDDYLNS